MFKQTSIVSSIIKWMGAVQRQEGLNSKFNQLSRLGRVFLNNFDIVICKHCFFIFIDFKFSQLLEFEDGVRH